MLFLTLPFIAIYQHRGQLLFCPGDETPDEGNLKSWAACGGTHGLDMLVVAHMVGHAEEGRGQTNCPLKTSKSLPQYAAHLWQKE